MPDLHPPLFQEGRRGPLAVTSFFGPRTGPVDPNDDFHEGIDIASPIGNPVFAVEDGVIVQIGQVKRRDGSAPAGNSITLLGESGTKWIYAHLDGFMPWAKKGTRMEKGQVLGVSGDTGTRLRSGQLVKSVTGPHLHFGAKQGDRWIDPAPEFQEGLFVPRSKKQVSSLVAKPVATTRKEFESRTRAVLEISPDARARDVVLVRDGITYRDDDRLPIGSYSIYDLGNRVTDDRGNPASIPVRASDTKLLVYMSGGRISIKRS